MSHEEDIANPKKIVEEEIILPDPTDFEQLVPTIPNLAVPIPVTETPTLISDEEFTGICVELLDNMREDRKQISEFIDNLAEMVVNQGDSTPASKEALVNLVKNKSDLSAHMLKLVDIWSRMKTKDTPKSPNSISATQNNTFNIGSDRRSLLQTINKAKKKRKPQ